MERTNSKYVIATSKRPGKTDPEFNQFLSEVKSIAAQRDVEVLGYVLVPGPGCWNHGMLLEGLPAATAGFAESLSICLMPAKYSEVSLDDPAVTEGQFGFSE